MSIQNAPASSIRRWLHAILAGIGFVPWVISVTSMTISAMFAIACERVWSEANRGNCWTYALPRWWRRGGYLMIRPADGQKFLKIFPVPHVILLLKMPRHGLTLEQFLPVERKFGQWFPVHTIYYEGEIRTSERPHNATTDT